MSESLNYFNGLPVPSYEELFIIQSERAIDADTDLNPYKNPNYNPYDYL